MGAILSVLLTKSRRRIAAPHAPGAGRFSLRESCVTFYRTCDRLPGYAITLGQVARMIADSKMNSPCFNRSASLLLGRGAKCFLVEYELPG
jgi:hypothetical protein